MADGLVEEASITEMPARGASAGFSLTALVDTIVARASEPWIPLKVGEQTLTEIPSGGHIILDGPTGGGKTSLATTIAVNHALNVGPVVYASLELSARMVAARIIGALVGATWADVLRGRVDRKTMLAHLPERFLITEGPAADIDALPAAISDARETSSGPVLVVVDYIQLAGLGGDGEDMRGAVARAAETLRAIAEHERAGVLVVSQPSRSASRDLRSGELTGAQTIGVSAESAQLERGATMTLAIGAASDADAEGWARVELSAGKGRYGGGDRVWSARYHGAHGRWSLDGAARHAAEVRAERDADREAAKVGAARLAIVAAASKSLAPLSAEELRARAAARKNIARAAIDAAVADGELVLCAPRGRSRYPTFWTAERRDAAPITKGNSHAD